MHTLQRTGPRGRRLALSGLATALLVTVFAMTAGVAMAIVNWEGFDWDELNTVVVDTDGNLVVTQDGSDFPSAHRDTDTDFRNSSTQSITFSFIDEGPGTVGGGIMLEHEPNAALTTFGVVPGEDEYQVFRLGFGLNEQTSTGVTRTAGTHTLQVVLLPDWSIDYILDGVLVYSSEYFGIEYFGDVYLRARGDEGDSVTYVSYLEETEYDEPSSINFNLAFFFGDCEPSNGPLIQAQLFGSGCRGFGLFFGDYDAESLVGAIRQEAYDEFDTFDTAVVRLTAYQLGSPFVEPVVISGGSCEEPPPFDPPTSGNIFGGLWIAWFSIEFCETVQQPA